MKTTGTDWRCEYERVKALNVTRGRKHLRLAKVYLSDFAPYTRRGRIMRAFYHLFISLFSKQY